MERFLFLVVLYGSLFRQQTLQQFLVKPIQSTQQVALLQSRYRLLLPLGIKLPLLIIPHLPL
jgi:hypothetical protein